MIDIREGGYDEAGEFYYAASLGSERYAFYPVFVVTGELLQMEGYYQLEAWCTEGYIGTIRVEGEDHASAIENYLLYGEGLILHEKTEGPS